LTDILAHLNVLNLKLQGKNQLITDLVSHIDGFRSKLHIFRSTLAVNNLAHFPSCETLSEDYDEVDVLDFSKFVTIIGDIIHEFDIRFQDFEKLRRDVDLFANPQHADVSKESPHLQMELCELQADVFLKGRRERGIEFFKLLSRELFPQLRDFGLRIASVFGSTYLCENLFSTMNLMKNEKRTSLLDVSSKHLLRLAVSQLNVDIPALVEAAPLPNVPINIFMRFLKIFCTLN